MKSTFVLSLDCENAEFVEALHNGFCHEDPEMLMNRLLSEERKRMNFTQENSDQDLLDWLIEDFTHSQIPAAG